jgi:transcriptional repressor of cell division inhibition gene dicB
MLKRDVIQHYGSQAAVGRELRIGRAAVNKWPSLVPEQWAGVLHVRTRGKLKYNPADYVADSSVRTDRSVRTVSV